jgi:hypothetical protein
VQQVIPWLVVSLIVGSILGTPLLIYRFRWVAARGFAETWRDALAPFASGDARAQGGAGAGSIQYSPGRPFFSYPHVNASIVVHGVRVQVNCTSYVYRARRSSYLVTTSRVVAAIQPPLDLAMQIRRGASGLAPQYAGTNALSSWLMRMSDSIQYGARGVAIGDPELERHLYLWAREPARLSALLTWPIRRALLAANQRLKLNVDDQQVVFESGERATHTFATWMVHDAAWLASAITHAARHVPPSAWAQHYRPLFEHAAKALGFRYTLSPAMLAGQLGGLSVWCWLVMRRTDESPGIRLQVAFAEPLGLGLKLRPAQDGSFGFLRPRDVQLGDAMLDDKLDIHATDPLGVQVAFDAKARALLHHLRDRGRVYIDDQAVALESEGALDPRDLVPLLQRARDLAALLGEGARARRTGIVGRAPR